MAQFDMPLEELKQYTPKVREEPDFDAFWKNTLEKSRECKTEPQFIELETPYKPFKVFDVTFSGFGGDNIKGWFITPRDQNKPAGTVIQYIGYGGGRGLSHEWMGIAALGLNHFIMDTRGQGSVWSPGDTEDNSSAGSNPQFPGFMTRGILSPENYYYRRVFTDAIRAYDAAVTRPETDPDKIILRGGSQGGAITLAAAGLLKEKINLILPDVPFMCHFDRSVKLVDTAPYSEIRNYLAVHRDHNEIAYKTLSYFDGVNFARRATADAVFSTALMDDICPPSSVFAAYNYYQGKKEIDIYDFNGHEGGGCFRDAEHHRILQERFNL